MHKIELTDGQLAYLQELVMFGYEMEVPEQKGWDVQTYDNLVDAVMQQCQFTKWHIVSPTLFKSGLYYKSNQRSINATNTNRKQHDRG